MKIIEPHIHMFSRTTDDYERMALSGIVAVVEPSFWLGSNRSCKRSFFDYFEHLLTFERKRAEGFGIKHHVCIAVNPKEANDERLAMETISGMQEYFARDGVVAVGEIGFDRITLTEEKVFRKQLEMAVSHGLLMLIHTPHLDKPRGTERILKIIEDMKLPRERILVDHNTEETIDMTRGLGVWAGHTVYPTKLSLERVVAILKKYGIERMIVNSSADWGPSDPLAVPKTAWLMRKEGFTEEQVKKLVFDNPLTFFSQSGRFELGGWTSGR